MVGAGRSVPLGVKVEIWSGVVCPWCYLGKRRFERALEGFEHRDEVEVRWRSFELDPSAPGQVEGDPVQRLVEKYGTSREEVEANQARLTELAAAEGLEYHLDRTRPGNTFDAHRLTLLATAEGRGEAAVDRLFHAYFTEGEPIGDPQTLVRLLGEIGIDEQRARSVLAGDVYAGEVRAEEAEAASLGASGVPFFVLDRRFGVSGAQGTDVFAAALQEAWDTRGEDPQPR